MRNRGVYSGTCDIVYGERVQIGGRRLKRVGGFLFLCSHADSWGPLLDLFCVSRSLESGAPTVACEDTLKFSDQCVGAIELA